MIGHAKRIALGGMAALLAAVVLKVVLFDLHGSGARGAADAPVAASYSALLMFAIAILPALLAAGMSEWLRLRHVAVHAGLGIAIALLSGAVAMRGEDMLSALYAGSSLRVLGVVLVGLVSGLVYWALSGRRAGWRGEAAEHAAMLSAEAFRIASSNARSRACRTCAAGALVAGFLALLLLGWISTTGSGLRDGLIEDAEANAQSVLRTAGYAWATFKIEGSRGVVTGLAPDEVQKRAAADVVREALAAVIGVPGIFAQVDNEAVARRPMSAVNKELEDATRRENEARVAAEAARISAEAARAGEADARRAAEEQARMAQEELKRRLEEQARVAEGEIKRKLEAQARLIEEEIKRKIDESARAAAEDEARRAEEEAAGAREAAKGDAQAQQEQPAASAKAPVTEVAALDSPDTAPSASLSEGAEPAAPDHPTINPSGACTQQDIAIVESSRIHFDLQGFEVRSDDLSELDRLAASVNACAPHSVLVTGHSDASRDSVFNPALGLQRAEAVRASLVERGVPAEQVIASSAPRPQGGDFGAGKGAEPLAHNRRAEFRFIEAKDVSRDATLDPEERATTCESDLSAIMTQSIIHFPVASARISTESLDLIRKLAGAIQTCGSVVVTVEGHTDKNGDAGYNQGLSELRAAAVKEALVAAGADPTRLGSKGFAASRPFDPGETREAFALNRRIEFRVSGKFTSSSTGGP